MKNFIRIITITTVIVLSLTPHAMFAQGWLLSGANTTLSPAGNKVGIGITPLAKLDVNGKIMTRHRLTLAQGNGSDPTTTKVWNLDNTNNDLRFFQEPNIATTGIVRMIIKDNGSVGIGTTTPDTKLHVAGGDIKCSAGGGFVSLHPNDGNIEIASANNQESYIDFKGYNNLNQDYRARISSNDDAGLGFFTNGSFPNTQMFITNAGKVGIGSNNPAAKLHVAEGDIHCSAGGGFVNLDPNDGSIEIASANNQISHIDFKGYNNLNQDYRARILSDDNNGLSFFTNGSFPHTQMFITNAGNVGIGIDNPTSKLEVVGGDIKCSAGGGFVNLDPNDGSIEIASANNQISYIDFKGYNNLNQDYRARILSDDNNGLSFFTNGSFPHTQMFITNAGNVGIGTGNPQYKLDICGNMRAKEVRVETGWCDYVFDKNYSLRPLAEVEAYIKENHHLPNIPSATTIETEGLEVASMLAKHMEKIEELTLYIIAQDKQLEQLKTRISQLEKQ